MLITLNKAAKLRKLIEPSVTKVSLPLKVRVSVLVEANRENPSALVQAARGKLDAELTALTRVAKILSGLNLAVAKANAGNGIAEIMHERVALDREVVFLNAALASESAQSDEEVREEALLAHRTLATAESYSRETSVTLPVVDAELRATYEQRRIALVRRREELEDQRLAINTSSRIEIADEDAEFLRERGLL